MNVIYTLKDLEGAVVIDNCATLRLLDGSYAVYQAGQINPEYNKTREFWDYDDTESITLPCEY